MAAHEGDSNKSSFPSSSSSSSASSSSSTSSSTSELPKTSMSSVSPPLTTSSPSSFVTSSSSNDSAVSASSVKKKNKLVEERADQSNHRATLQSAERGEGGVSCVTVGMSNKSASVGGGRKRTESEKAPTSLNHHYANSILYSGCNDHYSNRKEDKSSAEYLADLPSQSSVAASSENFIKKKMAYLKSRSKTSSTLGSSFSQEHKFHRCSPDSGFALGSSCEEVVEGKEGIICGTSEFVSATLPHASLHRFTSTSESGGDKISLKDLAGRDLSSYRSLTSSSLSVASSLSSPPPVSEAKLSLSSNTLAPRPTSPSSASASSISSSIYLLTAVEENHRQVSGSQPPPPPPPPVSIPPPPPNPSTISQLSLISPDSLTPSSSLSSSIKPAKAPFAPKLSKSKSTAPTKSTRVPSQNGTSSPLPPSLSALSASETSAQLQTFLDSVMLAAAAAGATEKKVSNGVSQSERKKNGFTEAKKTNYSSRNSRRKGGITANDGDGVAGGDHDGGDDLNDAAEEKSEKEYDSGSVRKPCHITRSYSESGESLLSCGGSSSVSGDCSTGSSASVSPSISSPASMGFHEILSSLSTTSPESYDVLHHSLEQHSGGISVKGGGRGNRLRSVSDMSGSLLQRKSRGSTQSSSEFQSKIKDQFYRIKLCPFQSKGNCKKGKDCSYAHTESQLRVEVSLYKTKLCQQWMNGSCENEKKGKLCVYAHGEQELRSTTDYFKTKLCRYWAHDESCPGGDSCRHAHGQHELRKRNYRRTELEKYAAKHNMSLQKLLDLIREFRGAGGVVKAVMMSAGLTLPTTSASSPLRANVDFEENDASGKSSTSWKDDPIEEGSEGEGEDDDNEIRVDCEVEPLSSAALSYPSAATMAVGERLTGRQRCASFSPASSSPKSLLTTFYPTLSTPRHSSSASLDGGTIESDCCDDVNALHAPPSITERIAASGGISDNAGISGGMTTEECTASSGISPSSSPSFTAVQASDLRVQAPSTSSTISSPQSSSLAECGLTKSQSRHNRNHTNKLFVTSVQTPASPISAVSSASRQPSDAVAGGGLGLKKHHKQLNRQIPTFEVESNGSNGSGAAKCGSENSSVHSTLPSATVATSKLPPPPPPPPLDSATSNVPPALANTIAGGLLSGAGLPNGSKGGKMGERGDCVGEKSGVWGRGRSSGLKGGGNDLGAAVATMSQNSSGLAPSNLQTESNTGFSGGRSPSSSASTPSSSSLSSLPQIDPSSIPPPPPDSAPSSWSTSPRRNVTLNGSSINTAKTSSPALSSPTSSYPLFPSYNTSPSRNPTVGAVSGAGVGGSAVTGSGSAVAVDTPPLSSCGRRYGTESGRSGQVGETNDCGSGAWGGKLRKKGTAVGAADSRSQKAKKATSEDVGVGAARVDASGDTYLPVTIPAGSEQQLPPSHESAAVNPTDTAVSSALSPIPGVIPVAATIPNHSTAAATAIPLFSPPISFLPLPHPQNAPHTLHPYTPLPPRHPHFIQQMEVIQQHLQRLHHYQQLLSRQVVASAPLAPASVVSNTSNSSSDLSGGPADTPTMATSHHIHQTLAIHPPMSVSELPKSSPQQCQSLPFSLSPSSLASPSLSIPGSPQMAHSSSPPELTACTSATTTVKPHTSRTPNPAALHPTISEPSTSSMILPPTGQLLVPASTSINSLSTSDGSAALSSGSDSSCDSANSTGSPYNVGSVCLPQGFPLSADAMISLMSMAYGCANGGAPNIGSVDLSSHVGQLTPPLTALHLPQLPNPSSAVLGGPRPPPHPSAPTVCLTPHLPYQQTMHLPSHHHSHSQHHPHPSHFPVQSPLPYSFPLPFYLHPPYITNSNNSGTTSPVQTGVAVRCPAGVSSDDCSSISSSSAVHDVARGGIMVSTLKRDGHNNCDDSLGSTSTIYDFNTDIPKMFPNGGAKGRQQRDRREDVREKRREKERSRKVGTAPVTSVEDLPSLSPSTACSAGRQRVSDQGGVGEKKQHGQRPKDSSQKHDQSASATQPLAGEGSVLSTRSTTSSSASLECDTSMTVDRHKAIGGDSDEVLVMRPHALSLNPNCIASGIAAHCTTATATPSSYPCISSQTTPMSGSGSTHASPTTTTFPSLPVRSTSCGDNTNGLALSDDSNGGKPKNASNEDKINNDGSSSDEVCLNRGVDDKSGTKNRPNEISCISAAPPMPFNLYASLMQMSPPPTYSYIPVPPINNYSLSPHHQSHLPYPTMFSGVVGRGRGSEDSSLSLPSTATINSPTATPSGITNMGNITRPTSSCTPVTGTPSPPDAATAMYWQMQMMNANSMWNQASAVMMSPSAGVTGIDNGIGSVNGALAPLSSCGTEQAPPFHNQQQNFFHPLQYVPPNSCGIVDMAPSETSTGGMASSVVNVGIDGVITCCGGGINTGDNSSSRINSKKVMSADPSLPLGDQHRQQHTVISLSPPISSSSSISLSPPSPHGMGFTSSPHSPLGGYYMEDPSECEGTVAPGHHSPAVGEGNDEVNDKSLSVALSAAVDDPVSAGSTVEGQRTRIDSAGLLFDAMSHVSAAEVLAAVDRGVEMYED